MPRRFPAWAALAAALFVPCLTTAQPKPDELHRRVLDGLTARCVGPANMGGRVVDLAVVESSPDTFYVATGGGGVWKTTDGGETFTPVFDTQPTLSTGAVAVCQGKPEVVYVGSGEGNPRNSVSQGGGVFRSVDGGKTWTHCGLADTHHIGRVVVHPTNPDIAYVAAVGHFWAANPERGLYKTTDGGKTWEKSKFLDENTGFVDVAMDPADPSTLYAAAWQVRRDAYSGGNPRTQTGPAGGLFKTTDAGKTWEKMGGGLPEQPYGRCGISVYRKDPNIVYAVVQTDKTAVTVAGQAPKPDDDPTTGGVFRSEDKGKTWKKYNSLVPRPFYYGQIRVDPTTDQRIYVLGVQFFASTDTGVTFTPVRANFHADQHALWVNPKNPDHLILGNDGGLYVSKDRGKTFAAKRGLVISQFYGVSVDDRTPYRVYGGLQDNGTWGGPVATPYPDGITLADWIRVAGADGFQCAPDPTDKNTVYAESQYGNLMRVNLGGAKGPVTKRIRPPVPKGGTPNRYNWNSPLLLSPHDPKTVYFGGQVVFKSTDRGDNWVKVSPDLTRAPKSGKVTNSGHTLTTLAESPVTAGVLWAGTDDGNVWVSRDDGKSWAEVGKNVPGVPAARWVTRVECSHADAGTAYLTLDRHRNDDFKPYIFKTTDYGATWTPITKGLPAGAVVGVVKQSSKNKELLFAGTELGLYATLDGGAGWHHMGKTGMPAHVRVDDVVIHPRERELVVGTHGRGIWVMDIAPLEQITEKVLTADAHLFDIKPVTLLKERKRAADSPKGYKAENPDGFTVYYWVGAQGVEDFTLIVKNPDGSERSKSYLGKPPPGLFGKGAVLLKQTGEYEVVLKVGNKEAATKKVTVKAAE